MLRERKLLTEKRKYPHFDPFVSLDKERRSLVFNPARIAGHSFFPLIQLTKRERRRKLDKASGVRAMNIKDRPIRYAAHLDAMIYSWYGFFLNSCYEDFLVRYGISQNILAYRPLHKTTPEFVKEVGEFIKKKGECAVLCFDIKDFFGTVSHGDLKKNWLWVVAPDSSLSMTRLSDDQFAIFESVTNFHYIEKKVLEEQFVGKEIPVRNGKYLPNGALIGLITQKHEEMKSIGREGVIRANATPGKGIPQGLPLSGVLANIALIDFDQAMNHLATSYRGIYRRYSDDILLVVEIGALNEAEKEIIKHLKIAGLDPNENKTERKIFKYNNNPTLECVDPRTGQRSHLQYLGLEFDGVSYYLRSQSISRYYRKQARVLAQVVRTNKRRGNKIVRHRSLLSRFTLRDMDKGKRNFMTYAQMAHQTLMPFSKIDKQVNDRKTVGFIKQQVSRRLK